MANQATGTAPKVEEKTTETKAQAFVRLANSRVGKALAAISVVSNLASPNYEYTPEQADKIIQALTSEIAVLASKFAKPEASAKTGFTL